MSQVRCCCGNVSKSGGMKATMYARQIGLRSFSVYQGRYSVQERDLEHEVIPMCKEEGMALQPFGVLGGGKVPPSLVVGCGEIISQVLDGVEKRYNVPISSVALAYVLQKPSVFL